MSLKDIDWQVDWLQFRVDFDSRAFSKNFYFEDLEKIPFVAPAVDPQFLTYSKTLTLVNSRAFEIESNSAHSLPLVFKFAQKLCASLGYELVFRDKAIRFYDVSADAVQKDFEKEVMFSFHYMKSKPWSLSVVATGSNAAFFNDSLTTHFSSLKQVVNCSMIRVDYAHDFHADFNLYDEKIRSFANEKSITTGKVQSSCDYEFKGSQVLCDASTRVMPSYSSRGGAGCFSRLYEKGKQQEDDPLWLRQEFEIKPGKFNAADGFSSHVFDMHCKKQYAKIIGFTRWASSYCEYVLDNLVAFEPPVRKIETPLFNSFLHMVKQYSKVYCSVSKGLDMTLFHQLMHTVDEAKEMGNSSDIENIVLDFYKSGENVRFRKSDITTLENTRSFALLSVQDGSQFKFIKETGALSYRVSSEYSYVHLASGFRALADAKQHIIDFLNADRTRVSYD